MEMMGVCLGEPVPAEYTSMAMEEMGFADRRLDWRTPADRKSTRLNSSHQ